MVRKRNKPHSHYETQKKRALAHINKLVVGPISKKELDALLLALAISRTIFLTPYKLISSMNSPRKTKNAGGQPRLLEALSFEKTCFNISCFLSKRQETLRRGRAYCQNNTVFGIVLTWHHNYNGNANALWTATTLSLPRKPLRRRH